MSSSAIRVTAGVKKANRIPINPPKKRTNKQPAYRPAGGFRMNQREKQVATLMETAWKTVPIKAINEMWNEPGGGTSGLQIAVHFAAYEAPLEKLLLNQIDESGIFMFDQIANDVKLEWESFDKAVTIGIPTDSPAPLPKKLYSVYSFTEASPAATQYAKTQSFGMIRDLTQSSQMGVQQVILSSFTEGITVGGLTKPLVNILQEMPGSPNLGQVFGKATNGLTERYSTAVFNRSKKILKATPNIGAKDLQKKLETYGAKLRRSRARTIARTEVMRASNFGRVQGMEQAVDKNLVSSRSMKRWSTGRFDVCNICVPLDKKTVPIKGGLFEAGNGWLGSFPPAHPNCRCTVQMVPEQKMYLPRPSASDIASEGATLTGQPLPATIGAPPVGPRGNTNLPGSPKVSKAPRTAANQAADELVDDLDLINVEALLEDTNLSNKSRGYQVFVEPDTGNQFVFSTKPLHEAELDVAVSRLQKKLGKETRRTNVTVIDGEVGSIQEVFGGKIDDTSAIFDTKFDPTKLTAVQVEALQQEAAFDYLISNHHSAEKNFVSYKKRIDPDLKPFNGDNSQAFKHSLVDRNLTDFNYNPNNKNVTRTAYNTLFDDAAKGKLGAGFKPTPASVSNLFKAAVREVDDGFIKTILTPYAEAAGKAKALPVNAGGVMSTPKTFIKSIESRMSNAKLIWKDLDYTIKKGIKGELKPLVSPAQTTVAPPKPTTVPVKPSAASPVKDPRVLSLKEAESAGLAYKEALKDGTEAATEALIRARKFDAKPKVVDFDKLGEFAERGKTGEMRRLVTSGQRRNPATGLFEEISPEEIAESYRKGQLFTGEGMYGRGTYVIEGTAQEATAYLAERQGAKAAHEIIEMTMQPGTRVYDMPEKYRFKTRPFGDELHDLIGSNDAHDVLIGLGYDAVRYPDNITVILNRGKVIVGKARNAQLEDVLSFPAKPTAVKPTAAKPVASTQIPEGVLDEAFPGAANVSDFVKLNRKQPNRLPNAEKLPKAQQAALKEYTGSFYFEVNQALMSAQKKGVKVSKYLSKNDMQKLKRIDASMKPIKEDVVVLRKTRHITLDGQTLGPDEALKNIKPGSIIEQPSFTSTTIRNQKYYGDNYEIKLEIFVDRRVKGSYLNDISAFGDEQELLLERGLNFIVENVQRIESTPGVTGQVVMQVRAVPRGLNWSQLPDAPLKALT